jgi:hypothetical protein
MSVEDEHLDVLQNIEFAIMQTYQEIPGLIDAEVMNALEALIYLYNAELQGKAGLSRPLRGTTATVAAGIKEACEMRLGRGSVIEKMDMEPKTITDILECLKRLKSSVKLWTTKGGRQGYLKFVQNFFQN